MNNTYNCYICEGTFRKGWADEQAKEEYEHIFQMKFDKSDVVEVCEPCYNHVVIPMIIAELSPNVISKRVPLEEPLRKEEEHVLWIMEGQGRGIKPGSFIECMIEAIMRADTDNLHRLAYGFPYLVGAVLNYRYGNLFERAEYHYGKSRT